MIAPVVRDPTSPIASVTSLTFVVIGAGRLGSSLALALLAAGAQCKGFTAGTPAGRARAEKLIGRPAALDVRELVSCSPYLYILAVPDDGLSAVAAELGTLLPSRTWPKVPVVCHTSGAASVAVLRPCEQAGAATLVFHPLQTFPEPAVGSTRLAGAAIAITPSETPRGPVAAALGFRLAAWLGSRPFSLPDESRTLYHAAATFACNYLVTLQYEAERLFIEAGLPPKEALSFFLPLARATLDNIEVLGPAGALTGPLSRGDVRTIERHLAALEVTAPDLVPLYELLGVSTLDLVRSQAKLDPATVAQLAALLAPADTAHPGLHGQGEP